MFRFPEVIVLSLQSFSHRQHDIVTAAIETEGTRETYVVVFKATDCLQVESNRPQTPLSQQQTRASQTKTQSPANQIEAMPPSLTPSARQGIAAAAPSPMYNPATTHPVFFTQSWRRPPFPMPFNEGISPAATGYVFRDARNRSQSMTKL